MAKSLIGISDQELVDGLKRLVVKEQKYLLEIILHFAEFDRRRLYAELGYTSLFDYATRGLGYSNSSAQRRIKAARAMSSVPEVYDCLDQGTLSLNVLEVVSDAIAGSKGKELLIEVCGKSKEEALRIVSHYHPIQSARLFDSIVPITLRTQLPVLQCYDAKSEETSNYFRAEVITDLVQESTGSVADEKFRIAFTAGAEFKRKLERVRELVSGSVGFGNTEMVLERVLDDFIKRHAPEERTSRRKVKAEKKAKAKEKRIVKSLNDLRAVSATVVDSMPEEELAPTKRRFVTAALRDEILERDGHCCSYVSSDGTKCGARMGLEIDHIIPWACGGRSEPENLRTACKIHNMMFARKIFGDEHVDSLIRERRLGGATQTLFLDPAAEFVFG